MDAAMVQEADTQTKLVATAAKLFSARGVQAVSMDDIAAAAGFTKRTLYYHFATKDALVAAWLTAQSAKIAATMPGNGAPAADILAVFDALAAITRSRGFRGCPFVVTLAELAGANPAATAAGLRHKEGRRAWFETRVAALGLADPSARAAELLTIWDGALASAVVVRDGTPAQAAARLARMVIGA
jgi:AcrR family transcriptional regulator